GRTKSEADVDYWGYSSAFDRRFHVCISLKDETRNILSIGDQHWRIILSDCSHYRSSRGRFMTNAWANIQPKKPDRLEVNRVYLEDRGGLRVTCLYMTPNQHIGSLHELELTYDVRRVSDKKRKLARRRELIREVAPFASDAKVEEWAKSGWWPETKP